MMMRFVPLLILIGIMLLGFVVRCFAVRDIGKRLDSTEEYWEKLVQLLNGLMRNKQVDNALYGELTEKVIAMQMELGEDGIIALMVDPLAGIQSRNHQFLVNFLPTIREVERASFFGDIAAERFSSSVQTCEDIFRRHMGQLKAEVERYRKNFFNPFACLADGVRWILWLPANILYWCGFISERTSVKLRYNWILKLLTFLVTLISLVGSIITIVLGWEPFWQMIINWFGGA